MANYIEYIKVGTGESWPVRDAESHNKLDSMTPFFNRNSSLCSGTLTINASSSISFSVDATSFVYGRPLNAISDSVSAYLITAYNAYRAPIVIALSNSSSLTISTSGDNTNGWFVTISNTSNSAARLVYVGNGIPTIV